MKEAPRKMKGRPFKNLRGALKMEGYDELDICEWINRGASYVSMRMMHKRPWTLEEMEIILDNLNKPREEMHFWFEAS